MPHISVVQLTDQATPPVPLVDEVRQGDPAGIPLKPYRLLRYSELEFDNWLLLDTDIIVNVNVQSVFSYDSSFDVAMLMRTNMKVGPRILSKFPELTGEKFVKLMPYNGGVIFMRNPTFFKQAFAWTMTLPPIWRDEWDQLAIAQIAKSGQYKITNLPEYFNYSPWCWNDPNIAKAFIVHYKGERKKWILGDA